MAWLRGLVVLITAGSSGALWAHGGPIRFVSVGLTIGAITLLDFHVSCSIAEHKEAEAEAKPEDPWEHHGGF